jgi:6-phosphofructokinase 1
VLVASHGEGTRALKIEDVAGKVKIVPPNHSLVLSARRVGTSFGD